jgi:hypothetical protein
MKEYQPIYTKQVKTSPSAKGKADQISKRGYTRLRYSKLYYTVTR